MKNQRVVYFYDDDIGKFYYAPNHHMKPHRVRMTHRLITAYGLDKKMRVLRPKRATAYDMQRFHTPDYIDYIQKTTPETQKSHFGLLEKFGLNEDCPVFEGLFEFCQISAGGSLSAAEELNKGTADIAINWAGGLHHAKMNQASGFCYVADCVLGILKLLERYKRVMYIDIDIHHGDGVEEAFYSTDRVLTVSFHKYGKFFPGTGSIKDIGAGAGKHYCINVPLKDGMDDTSFTILFKNIISRAIEWYRPEAILLQCGADSLTGDRLGTFNLTIQGHAECVKIVRDFGIPLILTGGGGYTVRNVARCWTYETALVLNEELDTKLPYNEYLSYYGPDYNLHIQPASNKPNKNSVEYLNQIQTEIFESIRHLPCAPSLRISTTKEDVSKLLQDSDESDDEFYDTRITDACIRPGYKLNYLSDVDI